MSRQHRFFTASTVALYLCGCNAQDHSLGALSESGGEAGTGTGAEDSDADEPGADEPVPGEGEMLPADVRSVCDGPSQVQAPRLFSAAYQMSCAGCHGVVAEGFAPKAIPALPGEAASLEAFEQVVRQGRHADAMGMPPFDEQAYDHETLAADWALMHELPLEQRAAQVQEQPSIDLAVSMDAATIDATFEEGLEIWRTDSGEGACATCHGPEAVDLARIGFSDADILRRAMGQQIPGEDAQKIVGMVHAVRAKYGMRYFCDPRAPFLQPGDRVLAGDTPEQKELALFEELGRDDIGMAGPLVHTHEEAKQIVDNIGEQGVFGISIGYEMNRWTEDAYFGNEHRSVSEWIPELSRKPQPGLEEHFYALHDDYIDDPSPSHLWAIYDALPDETAIEDPISDYFESWNLNKLRGVLMGQHMLRTNRLELPELFPDPADFESYKARHYDLDEAGSHHKRLMESRGANAIWTVGIRAIKGAAGSGGMLEEPLPSPHAETTRLDEGTGAFFDDVGLSWPWMYLSVGLSTPSMQFIEGGRASTEYYITTFLGSGRDKPRQSLRLHLWMTERLFMHIGTIEHRDTEFPAMAGANAFHSVEPPTNGIWTDSLPRADIWTRIDLGNYMSVDGSQRLPADPTEIDDAQLALDYVENQFWRIALLRMIEQLETTGDCPMASGAERQPQPEKLEAVRAFLLQTSPVEDAQWVDETVDRALELVLGTCELAPYTPPCDAGHQGDGCA